MAGEETEHDLTFASTVIMSVWFEGMMSCEFVRRLENISIEIIISYIPYMYVKV